uniref:Uncharacterized protein n=1 Tax=viral metagenome TaxID=1070528 RepID=A0A6M3JK04_9ZZZZ
MVSINRQRASRKLRQQLRLTTQSHKAVFVRWVDPSSYSPWHAIADCEKREPMGQWSVGWLVVDNPDRVTIALTLADDRDCVSDIIVLPRGCVQEIVEVKV